MLAQLALMQIRFAVHNSGLAIRRYWPLIKDLQTGLLLLTGVAGFLSAACPAGRWLTLLGLAGSLFLAISGSTVLNMAYDADIDAMMRRTCWRPLPRGLVTVRQAVILGAALSILGVGWALLLAPLYGLIVFVGLFFDVAVYTVWLKRRTPYAIIIGGLAGGMPVLAGRTLALGQVDLVGLMLALGVLLWIPTHIMTFAMRHFDDYQIARVPTFPAAYGFSATRAVIAVSSLAAALVMGWAAAAVGAHIGLLAALGVMGLGLLGLALLGVVRPSPRASFALFKYASLYMFAAMVVIAVAA
ncbi:MAG: Protoheme IX farnesyltransferase 2 [Chloroflexi bacterium ADurb.Bin325]|nr:MAG: Protoheme IX farnesyltransferase 2 [Chloroflexi bacterium ADurb.Bin325]